MITCNNTQCKHCIDNTCTHHNIKISDMGTCLTYHPDTYIGKCTSCKNFCTVKYNDNKIYNHNLMFYVLTGFDRNNKYDKDFFNYDFYSLLKRIELLLINIIVQFLRIL